jgi:hypothetical protein
MKISMKKEKTAAIIVTVLMLTSVALMALPAVAQEGSHGGVSPENGYVGPTTKPADAPANTIDIPTIAYLGFRPNPIGVNEPLLLNFWITPPPSNDRFLAKFQVDIKKPDGSTDTIGPVNSYNADGTSWAEYVVDQVGTWSFKFSFPGEYFPPGNYSGGVLYPTAVSGSSAYAEPHYYESAATDWQDLTVISEQVLSYPPAALPTDYWTRPIEPDNREWYAIAGPYPWPWTNWDIDDMGPWITAPTTSHIAWSKVNQIGGIIGGDTGASALTGSPGYPTVIYAGRGYQTYNKPGVGSVAACYDIRTGEVYYEIPTSAGGVTPVIVAYNEQTVNDIGAVSPARYELLGGSVANGGFRDIGSTLQKIDPLTGAVSSYPCLPGLFYNGHYVLSVQTNNTAAGRRLINWTTTGSSTNFQSRIISNISTTYTGSTIGHLTDFDAAVTVSVSRFSSGSIFGGNVTAWSLITGQVIYTFSTGTVTPFNPGCAGVYNGKFAFACEDRFWQCYNIYTGDFLWKSELADYPWGDFWSYDSSSWNNMLYAGSYVGMIAFDWDTGKIVWQTPAYSDNFETPYNGEQAWHSGTIVADGKLYSYTDEHTATQPLTRGWEFYCFNATTGEILWQIDGWSSVSRTYAGSVSDGYLAVANQYDGITYIFGKGKTAATVTASPKTSALGDMVLIEGTVMDMSPAQPGTPCVSADSMTTQMQFLHMQQPVDGYWHNESITGVPVMLTAIASDGTVTDLGTATTNGYYGTFSVTWTPPSEGKYEIVASFNGDDSYGSSYASTAVAVGPAPETGTDGGSGTEAAPDNTMLLYGILVAVIIAIVLAVIAIVAIFGKR